MDSATSIEGVNYDADGKPVKRGEPLRDQIIQKK